MPYNPLAYPYQLNTRELPSNQVAAEAYLALPYASSSGPWGGPTVGSTWSQSPYYLPNWGDESQTPGTPEAQATSPVSTASVTRPDAVIDARDINALAALNTEKTRLTAVGTNVTAQIAAINAITGGAPGVVSVNPNSGASGTAHAVTIMGSGFSVSTPTVNIGGSCTSVVVVNDGELTCSTPVGSVTGVSNVAVTTTAGTGTLTGGFTYTGPTVTGVSPNSTVHGSAHAVTVTGSGFSVSTPTVNIGGACTSVVVVDDQHLTCSTPAGSVAGTADVTVTTTAGVGKLTGGMTYT